MSALERLAGIAKYEGSRRHKFAAGRASVLKAARNNDCNGCAPMALLERPVLGAGSTNNVLHLPALSTGDSAHFQPCGDAAQRSTFQGTLQFDRNICQVFHRRSDV
jgi:hypothetical protein